VSPGEIINVVKLGTAAAQTICHQDTQEVSDCDHSSVVRKSNFNLSEDRLIKNTKKVKKCAYFFICVIFKPLQPKISFAAYCYYVRIYEK